MLAARPPSHVVSPVQDFLERLHQRFAPLRSGQVATYIPELAKADPDAFGIVVATVDGQVYEVGDTRVPFTIQSISKALVYGIALEDRGLDEVRRSIGMEPSGDAFNSISLEPGTGRPLNPMINAGAIATTSLVAGSDRSQRLERVLSAISAFAGRPLAIDESVFESERATGHRNRAIGHMLRSYGIVPDDPEEALELYFRQCSILVDCRDLALVAATLANGGLHPRTGERAVREEFVGPILSVMTTCGMYDFAGEWAVRVGLPAKSGVGGGIIAVLPGQLGIGVWSPALDEHGNSVRGVKVCESLSSDLGLHFLQPPRASVSTVRARYDLRSVRSKRRWPAAATKVLDAEGGSVAVLELQGDLRFATLEPVLRDVVDDGQALRFVVIDFRRVTQADGTATRMLAQLVGCCAARGQQVVLTRVRRGLLDSFGAELDPRLARSVVFQPQLDLGLEWCERRLLDARDSAAAPAVATLAAHDLCAGADADDVRWLEERVERASFEPGSMIVRRGDLADALYFLMVGDASVVVPLAKGGDRRLVTLSPGMGFGEAGLLSGGRRTADVRANTVVECRVLRTETFQRMERERPSLAIRLLHNLLRSSAATAGRLTAEVAALES